MLIKGLVEEDFTNYKKASMFVIFPTCTFKCDKEAGCQICQNSELAKLLATDIPIETIVSHYINNPITKAIVFGGLEPLDSEADLFALVDALRQKTDDDIVIYTGYYKDEIKEQLNRLSGKYKNIIVKFGRFIPNCKHRFDSVLGIELASNNQFAEQIS